MGRWDKDGNWAVGACIAVFFAIGLWLWWSYYWDFSDLCPTNEQGELALCARSWIGALAGYFATIVGALTILVLLTQINQSERHREAALQREGRLVADMLLIDLLVTAERFRGLARKTDLDPPLAEISRKMIPEAVKVTPVLAIALQKHCLEVSEFVNRALQNFQLAGQLLPPQIDDRRKIAFRATVLARCFGGASTQIEATGNATGPFMNQAELEVAQSAYVVGPEDLDYLDYIFQATGLAKR
ncbi:hypothetical protein [Mesorhizobium sp.]|uniref:hypothetical protein n=1 Tax=Mesorhizobium sp. TaxID=1871066 RepID=UPI000FE6F535|nr:hypothetical protein [Mesorhizobium sp.]RWM29792.1 MAG: hypothetical protein EOR75_31945 [Mesorhizobium sp.]TJV47690.1 MAG: hypothetical protein E5Y01_31800 [Mesorhizobium sp.]